MTNHHGRKSSIGLFRNSAQKYFGKYVFRFGRPDSACQNRGRGSTDESDPQPCRTCSRRMAVFSGKSMVNSFRFFHPGVWFQKNGLFAAEFLEQVRIMGLIAVRPGRSGSSDQAVCPAVLNAPQKTRQFFRSRARFLYNQFRFCRQVILLCRNHLSKCLPWWGNRIQRGLCSCQVRPRFRPCDLAEPNGRSAPARH